MTLQKVAKVDWRETNPPQFPEQLKYLPGFFGHGDSIGGEGDICGQVDSEELDAVYTLYTTVVSSAYLMISLDECEAALLR